MNPYQIYEGGTNLDHHNHNHSEDQSATDARHRRWRIPHLSISTLIKIGVIAILALVVLVSIFNLHKKPKVRTSIVSKSSLEKILQISDLSTYKAVYNGVAHVKDAKGEKVLYHVSYESEVKVGFDTEAIAVDVDNDNKKVIITLPEIKINDVTVKMESLDYIFEDNSANTPSVSNEAYAACIEDAKSESASNDQIFELARDNSENLVRALIEPLLKQNKDTYTLDIR